MAILVVLSTLSMAWFFSANTAALDGLNSLPENVQIMVDDAQFFINNTESELMYVTNNNFDEFSENVDTTIEDIKTNVDDTIDTVIEDIHFDELVRISYFLMNLATDFNDHQLDDWERALRTLRNQLGSVKYKIQEFKQIAMDSLYCPNPTPPLTPEICKTIDDIPKIDMSILPTPNQLEDYKLDPAIINAINGVKSVLDEAEGLINGFSSQFIDDNVKEIREKIDEIRNDITNEIKDIIDDINEFSVEELYEDELQKPLLDAQDYFDYVYYTVLGFGLFLVAILALYAIGICLGAFGKVGGPAKRQGIAIHFL